MLHLKCFNIPIQGQKINLMVSTITTSLDKTIASLDLEPCVCINTTGRKRMRDKKKPREDWRDRPGGY